MILGIGSDILDVARVTQALERDGDRFREDVFSAGEISYCEGKRHPAQHYAARFAAKEAFVKALGNGVRDGIVWRDIEIRHEPTGQPRLRLSGASQRLADGRGVRQVHLTLSHTAEYAAATVILEG
jgi:holo-[acyl-carrier protein] synthase